MMQRKEFTLSLEELQQEILKMGSLVEENITRAIDALAKQDLELMENVIKQEEKIDQMEIEIEETCMKLLATQQPMAKDLRIIGTALKIITDLERMGDYAEDIAKVTKRIKDEKLIKPLVDIPRMARLTQEMVHLALEAYVKQSQEQAYRLGDSDDEVDQLHKQVFRELLLLMMENPRTINQATHLLFVSRSLERIADHTTNIGEKVIYLVTGKRVHIND